MSKCTECAFCECARGLDDNHIEIKCFKRKRIRIEGKLIEFDSNRIDVDCSEFFRKIPNISHKEAFDIQREEAYRGKEFSYAENALKISSKANEIAKDSKIWAIIAIVVSVFAFIVSSYLK